MISISILTPTEKIDKEADMVQVPTSLGETGILNGHAPLVTVLTPGFIKLTNGEKKTNFEVTDGILSVDENKVEIFTSSIAA